MYDTARLPQQLPSARGNTHQHYENLNAYSRVGLPASAMDMRFWQIDEAIFDEFLGMLPPVYVTGGFMMCEKLTGDIATYFTKVGADYWCGDCTRADVPKLRARIVAAMEGANA
jgi:hypothetical protein